MTRRTQLQRGLLWLFAAAFFGFLADHVAAQDQIFADGFEAGDVRRWQAFPPALVEVTPIGWSQNRLPVVSARFASTRPIDLQAVQVQVAGVEVTDQVTLDEDGFTWTASEALEDGRHGIRVEIADIDGTRSSSFWRFGVDNEPPVVTVLEPTGLLIDRFEPPIVAGVYDQWSSASELETRLRRGPRQLDADCSVRGSVVTCLPLEALPAGAADLRMLAVDLAGNRTLVDVPFELVNDLGPPTLQITSPADGSMATTPSVLVEGTAADDLQIVGIEIDGRTVATDAGPFSARAALTRGANTLRVAAVDAAGKRTETAVTVHLDVNPPSLTLDPASVSGVTNGETVTIRGSARDESGIVTLEAAIGARPGQPLTLAGDRFEGTLELGEGANEIVVRAVDAAGLESTRTASWDRRSLPEVTITSPVDLSTVASTTIDVEGTVSQGATVVVDGRAATVVDGAFTVAGVPLTEGGNLLTATATTAAGSEATDTVVVVRDLTPPRLAIYRPADGAVVGTSSITVAGLVNDLVAGTVNASEVAVEVDRVPAVVANRSFVATVPLVPGTQTIRAVALDEGGNQAVAEVEVTYVEPSGPHLEVAGGDGQTASIGATLPEPLTVRAVDAAGEPVADVTVVFSVDQGNGRFVGSPMASGRRIAATTDAGGLASVSFVLGTRAGVANHVVVAQVVGFGPPAQWTASAEPGPAAVVLADAGVEQTGVAGRALPRPLVATITDEGFNRLGGVPVTFRVVRGDGIFPRSGAQEIEVVTDSDGRAIVQVVLDSQEGQASTLVVAEFVAEAGGGGPGRSATFVGSGLAAGDPADTAIVGLVLDGSGVPIEGVTVRVRDTAITTTTDAEGYFRIRPAPVGTLYLIVDGSTAQRPGVWPDLEYVVTTVPGREVDVGGPIHLLPLDVGSGAYVDETTGGTVEIPGIPGFRLEIEPGSATFPGGGRSGIVSATAVHHDRIPMTPNFGQQPRLIVTIQPAGARFDPPARLVLPNVEQLEPGEVTEMYSFDHDLGHFVSIGPASVSRDGSEIVADPGVGIVKAGWHCGGNPSPGGTPYKCPPCTECDGSQCVPLGQGSPSIAAFGKQGDEPGCGTCKVGCRCGPNGPEGDPVEIGPIEPEFCAAPWEQSYTFRTKTNGPEMVDWKRHWDDNVIYDGPGVASGQYDTYSTIFPDSDRSIYPAKVEAFCSGGAREESDEFIVGVPCDEIKTLEVLECPNQGSEECLGPDATGIEDQFGRFVGSIDLPPPDPDETFGAGANCAEGSGTNAKICSTLNVIEWGYFKGIDFQGKTPIHEGEMEQVADAGNCIRILLDLAPLVHDTDSDVCGAFNQTWVYVPALEKHEDRHLEDYEKIVLQGVIDSFSGRLEDCDCEEDYEIFEVYGKTKDELDEKYEERSETNAEIVEQEENRRALLELAALAEKNDWFQACRKLVVPKPIDSACEPFDGMAGGDPE